MQICCQLFFPTLRESLHVSIINSDTLSITLFTFQTKEKYVEKTIMGKKNVEWKAVERKI